MARRWHSSCTWREVKVIHQFGQWPGPRCNLRIPSDKEWTVSRVDGFPIRWQRLLLGRWEKQQQSDYVSANIQLRKVTEVLRGCRISLDASDDQVCDIALQKARHCIDLARVLHEPVALREAMERYCVTQGVLPPGCAVRLGPALARMTCEFWWRRKLRRHHGCAVETAAIHLGVVSRVRDLYVSKERFEARTQQNTRNKKMLDTTLATNEMGQTYSLAELAAFSTSKKSNRRAELMARVVGFDRLAQLNGHAGVFITLTCPSRFHRFTSLQGREGIVKNRKYEVGATPAAGQKYLAKLWSRARAKLHRNRVRVYGFRVSEPQHDGTPHWHMLLFCEKAHEEFLSLVLTDYALRDTPNEPGAAKHRCVIKNIDWTKGSAAGYIAKYISKNIDGEHVGADFNGRPATETAARVEAWAATWSIRQFQQIGGPTVGVWRELRRISEIPSDAPALLKQAHDAANKFSGNEETEELRVRWDKYCEAQGGVLCGRVSAIKLAMQLRPGLGRYGEELSAGPCGVQVTDEDCYTVYSKRHTWTMTRATPSFAKSSGAPLDWTKSSPAWTCVNNCTRHTNMTESMAPKKLKVRWSPTGMEGVQPAHPTVATLGQGGANFETVCQPPLRGTDVQEVAQSAGATVRTPPGVRSEVGGLAPPLRKARSPRMEEASSNDEPG